MKLHFFTFLALLVAANLLAQDSIRPTTMTIDGEIVSVTYEGRDTLLVTDLEEVSVTVPRTFDDMDDYIRYQQYKRKALKVYPYAVEAIKIFREMEKTVQPMNKRQRKKHIRRLHRGLKKEFADPLKKLSKTEGRILIEMIEKELDDSFYDLMRNLRGGLTATYWSSLSRLYGYRLKEKYTEGEDKVLDAVLHDLDVSYKYK